RELAAFLGCEASEEAVLERRLATDFDAYAAELLRATNTEAIYLDDGFPADGTTPDELAAIAACEARPVMRIEGVGPDGAREAVASARAGGFAALKTIAAYRTGLHHIDHYVLEALEENEASGAPLPVQVHCGFGDSDLSLPHADPGWLKPVIERFPETSFVL